MEADVAVLEDEVDLVMVTVGFEDVGGVEDAWGVVEGLEVGGGDALEVVEGVGEEVEGVGNALEVVEGVGEEVVEGGGDASLNFANPMQGFVEPTQLSLEAEVEHDSFAQE